MGSRRRESWIEWGCGGGVWREGAEVCLRRRFAVLKTQRESGVRLQFLLERGGLIFQFRVVRRGQVEIVVYLPFEWIW
jgi:hypothetical protein